MPIQGIRFTINSQAEAHQSFQSTGSFVAYNPNDGVALIALDRTATGTDYDHRLPSQSGGRFPGPINSYLSIYYIDQSGGGLAASIVVYATPESLDVPHFWSIGRALTSFSTTLDIVQGSQPANPGAGITRLWSDSGGHLNLLQSNGTSWPVLDSNNASTYVTPIITATPLGGDLTGTIPNGHVLLANGSSIQARDSGSTVRGVLMLDSSNNTVMFNAGGGLIRFLNQAGTLELAHFDNTGNFVVAGTTTIGSILAVNGQQVTVPQGSWYCFQDSNSRVLSVSRTMYFDEYNGGWYWRNSAGGFATSASLTSGGTLNVYNELQTNGGVVRFDSGGTYAYIQKRADLSGTGWTGSLYVYSYSIRCDSGGGSGGGFVTNGASFSCDGNVSFYQLANQTGSHWFRTNGGTAWAPMECLTIAQHSTIKDKLNIVVIDNPLSFVLDDNLHGVYYDDRETGKHNVGFVADYWLDRVPEIVVVDDEGDARAMNYDRVGAITFEAVKILAKKVEALEERLAAI